MKPRPALKMQSGCGGEYGGGTTFEGGWASGKNWPCKLDNLTKA